MKEFSVWMSVVDFIPVILFAAASVILQRELYNKMSKGAFALFAAGTVDVIVAGGAKALYKLLYALSVCDFERLDAMFFPLQSVGFLLAGLGVAAMLFFRQSEKGTPAAAVSPAVFSGTFIFVGLMVAGLGMICAGLSVLSCKLKKKSTIALFVLSFVCSLCMGYLSTKNFDKAYMNWIAECVNIVGEASLLIGVVILKKNGLLKLKLEN